jgi:transcriptional regulator with XRE-family HTH domain
MNQGGTMDVARALREIASEKRISQADLCERIGMSDAHMSQIFTGKVKNPKARDLYRIAHAMDMTVDDILARADSYEH